MWLEQHSKHNFRLVSASLLAAFLIAGCGPKEEPETLSAPRMTMDLPVSLSGIVTATTTNNAKAGIQSTRVLQAAEAVTDPALCEQYFDSEADFMENGYSMTRFLVGLSQSQSCFADFIMNAVVSNGTAWVNKGLITLPENPDDPGAPSHVQIESSGSTVQVWLYFGTPETALPTDLSTVKTLYLTWTGTAPDVYGQYYMVNMPINEEDLDAPAGVRVDFIRKASTAENKIYLKLRDSHSGGLGGFRIDVTRTGVDSNATYTAKGLITFLENPFPNTPAGISPPNFTASAIVDDAGLGASIANFNNFALALKDTDFDLGSYQFTIADKTYFNPDLYDETDNTTPYGEQLTEWRNKSAQNAIYISEQPRIIPSPESPYSILKCMEASTDFICDYNGNNELDDTNIDPATGQPYGEWMGWGLGAGYFTDAGKCVADASVETDCTLFVDKFFNDNQFGSQTLNSTTAEPTDARNAQLDTLTQLGSVNPDTDPDGVSTFIVPDAPIR